MDVYLVEFRKRPDKGLLAGMYEFPNLDGKLTMDEVTAYSKSIGLAPIRVKKLRNAKHIFSHIEWHMTAYGEELQRRDDLCTSGRNTKGIFHAIGV